MTDHKFSVKYWEHSGDILVTCNGWECFLRNEMLNPIINWMNLHRKEIESGGSAGIAIGDTKDCQIFAACGQLTISAYGGLVFLDQKGIAMFVNWMNAHRDVLNTREVWP